MIIFVSGGARSGKSNYAEEMAISLSKQPCENKKGRLYYIATAKKSDDEMIERITIHQAQRAGRWQTVEEHYHIEDILSNCRKDDVMLLDCLTIWLSNVSFELGYNLDRVKKAVASWLDIAGNKHFHLVIVSNDVHEGMPPSDEVVFSYMYTLQQLHQLIVQRADLAVEVQAGIPIIWKEEK